MTKKRNAVSGDIRDLVGAPGRTNAPSAKPANTPPSPSCYKYLDKLNATIDTSTPLRVTVMLSGIEE